MPLVKLPNGQLRDEIRQPLYDTITISAGESPVGTRQFFANVQGKSLIRTNLKQNKLLEVAVSFRIQGMTLDCQNIYDANKDALALIQEDSSLRLAVGEKNYWSSPAQFVTGRLEQNAAVSTGTGTATDIVRNYQRYGAQAIQPLVFQGKHVVDILPLQAFYVEMVTDDMTAAEIAAATPAAATRLHFVLALRGLLRRPVQ